MVLAWYMDDDTSVDQRQEHKTDPIQLMTLDELKRLGVNYWYFDPLNFNENPEFNELKQERGYSYQDQIECSPEKLENYEQKLRSFYDEHIHTDEEIRYVMAGLGYFDVRDLSDRWIRIAVTRGDLIVLPAGIHHRFTLDADNYIKALRLFIGEPVWTPFSRSSLEENNLAVIQYRQKFVLDQQLLGAAAK